MGTADERHLLAAARAGDEAAFGRIAARHRPKQASPCPRVAGYQPWSGRTAALEPDPSRARGRYGPLDPAANLPSSGDRGCESIVPLSCGLVMG
jgi:hypothetical protein